MSALAYRSLVIEAEELEQQARELRADAGLVLVALRDSGLTLEQIAGQVGVTRERVRQLVAANRPRIAPDLGPGEAELALHRSEIATRAGRASGVARRVRKDGRALLDELGVPEFYRAECLRFVARAMSDELRPLGRREAVALWLDRCGHASVAASA